MSNNIVTPQTNIFAEIQERMPHVVAHCAALLPFGGYIILVERTPTEFVTARYRSGNNEWELGHYFIMYPYDDNEASRKRSRWSAYQSALRDFAHRVAAETLG